MLIIIIIDHTLYYSYICAYLIPLKNQISWKLGLCP